MSKLFNIVTFLIMSVFLFSCSEDYIQSKKIQSGQDLQSTQVRSGNNGQPNEFNGFNGLDLSSGSGIDLGDGEIKENLDSNLDDLKTLDHPYPKIMTNFQAQKDCSDDNSWYSPEVNNADSDIKACKEHDLFLPAGQDSMYKTFRCDNPSKFVPLINQPGWVYRYSSRSFFYGAFQTRNSFIVPGRYRSVVMDRDGNVFYSEWATVARPGFANCNTDQNSVPIQSNNTNSQTGSTTNTLGYDWVDIIPGSNFSPMPGPPKKSCGPSNLGEEIVADVRVTWKCQKI